MARIWIDGRPKDKSTKINVTGEYFDLKERRFTRKSPNQVTLNQRLAQFESLAFNSVAENKPIQAPVMGSDGVTLSSICSEYKAKLDANQIFNKKNGKLIAYTTRKNNLCKISRLQEYLKTNPDFNFSEYNASVPKSKHHYNTLISSLKSYFYDLDNNSLCSYLAFVKSVIKTVCSWHDIELGSLLNDLKVNSIEKDVIILDQEQFDFVLNNYDQMYEDCKTETQRTTMQYWYAALILDPRKKDMMSWTMDNLYQQDGAWWIKYSPSKTKGSGKIIDVPVFDGRLVKMFLTNHHRYGKLLPTIPDDSYFAPCMKIIAKRYKVFHKEVQVFKKGELVVMPMYKYIKLHQMRATGNSHKLMAGIPENIAIEFTGHVHGSRSRRRYLKTLNTHKAKYLEHLRDAYHSQTEAK